jgi:hypothetical protein
MIAGALAAPPKPRPPQTGDSLLHEWAVRMGCDYGRVPADWDFRGLAIRMDEPGIIDGDGPLGEGVWWVIANHGCGDDAPVMVMEGNLSTTCGDGYYACCYCVTTLEGEECPLARCRQNGVPEPPSGCQGGGPGATSCSIGQEDCP